MVKTSHGKSPSCGSSEQESEPFSEITHALAVLEVVSATELRPAMAFALIFTVVLLAVAAAVENFGSGALYGVAVLSGLTDMDAITLSTLQMLDGQRVEPDTAWRVILCGAMSNVVFKAVMALALGGPALFRRLCLFFGVSLGGGLAIVFLYPTP